MSINNYGGLSSHSTAATNHRALSGIDNSTSQQVIRCCETLCGVVSGYGITIGIAGNPFLIIHAGAKVYPPYRLSYRLEKPFKFDVGPFDHQHLLQEVSAFELDTDRARVVRVKENYWDGLDFCVALERLR